MRHNLQPKRMKCTCGRTCKYDAPGFYYWTQVPVGGDAYTHRCPNCEAKRMERETQKHEQQTQEKD